jgi:Endonuclease NucS N-terminal PH-like domain
MDAEHREDFERRLLAKVRSSLDYLDETNPQGYEIEHFVLTFRYYRGLEPDERLEPWDGGRYVGMHPSGFTTVHGHASPGRPLRGALHRHLTARPPEAVRLLMFKADGSFLVHDDAGGFRPLNRVLKEFRPE